MREIKFRAWNKKKKFMDTAWCIDFEHELVCHREHNQSDLKDCILMQYTGLKDCEGNKIYEGDILLCKTINKKYKSIYGIETYPKDYFKYKKSTVEWWSSNSNHGYRLRDEKGKVMMIKPSSLKRMEVLVIGNIYENKEGE